MATSRAAPRARVTTASPARAARAARRARAARQAPHAAAAGKFALPPLGEAEPEHGLRCGILGPARQTPNAH